MGKNVDHEKKMYRDFDYLDEFVRLSYFADIGIGIAAAKSIEEGMRRIMDKIGDIFAPLSWYLVLQDKNSGEFYYKLVFGVGAGRLKGSRFPKGEGTIEWIFKNEAPLLIEDMRKDNRFSSNFHKNTGFEIRSMVGVPLSVNDEIVGVIELINKQDEDVYNLKELKVLITMAEYAALTIEKIYYNSALRDISNGDALTGVYNRRSFDTQIVLEMERCRRYNHPLSMMIVDVDELKGYNEYLGPKGGDWVLKDTARVLKKCLRKIDIIARYRDDEFAVIMPHTSRENAEKVRERIINDLEKENLAGKEIPYRLFIGIGSAEPEKVYDLVRLTDEDLCKWKEEHKKAEKKEN
jgi:diguanylate cyclase (GGDEF)-like protein